MEEVVIPVAKNNPTKMATKWALINALVAIVITYVFELFNVDPNSSLKYLTYIPFILFLFLSQKEFRDQIGGFMTFGEGFSVAFRYALFTGLVMAVFIYLYCTVLSPSFFDKAMELSRTKMEEQGKMSSEQIDKAMEISKKWGPLFAAFGTAVVYPIFGAIIGLIGATIFKKERTDRDIVENATDPTV
ncbi:DUF4199 domain-containing protein [Mucilaginibacter corticis]|uniref:DUF4199 domain-containing protein n=1 Tax=Mucilaginibacter corticis TaxID=2597670 RepID=A0A556MHQ7_9SPHI|nr:DUF4199 domain-containing protein [Mucilaginibacter corticis]TSJ39418.1 DUF4199 domain-containing protein [Mucilaginibacter corticis]